MAREPLHSANVRTEQPAPLTGDLADREPEVVLVDPGLMGKEYQDELSFMADWLTIRLEPSGQENAPDTFPIWVNGRGAEILVDGRPVIWTHLPVGPEITVRRSVVEIIARSKTMRVQTDHTGEPFRQLANKTNRHVSQNQPFSIIHDPSERGRAWASEMVRRSF
jgi:hypothetical protein